MQNNCTTSDRLKRFVFQRCRLLLIVNVKKSTLSANMRHCTVYETVARGAIILHTPVGSVSSDLNLCIACASMYLVYVFVCLTVCMYI